MLPKLDELLSPTLKVVGCTYLGNSKNADKDELFKNWSMQVEFLKPVTSNNAEKGKQTSKGTRFKITREKFKNISFSYVIHNHISDMSLVYLIVIRHFIRPL